MRRLALVADTHADASNRLAEHDRIMQWIAEDGRARGVDLWIHAGDAWERRSTSVERASVGSYVLAMTEHAPLVVVAGNHDDPLDIAWLGKLRTRHPVVAFDRPGVTAVGGFAVAALPWPRKANLLSRLGAVSPEDSSRVAQEALRDVLRGLALGLDDAADAEPDRPRILACHVMIDGARTDHGQPLVGCDMNVSLADLGLARAGFVACGHVHAANDWLWNEAPVVYPGAPRHTNFGEAAEGKGYVIVEWDGSVCGCSQGYRRGTCPVCQNQGSFSWERVPTPCTPMVLLDVSWDAALRGLEVHGQLSEVRGAEVRLRVRVDPDQREPARAAAEILRDKLLGPGAAVSVRVEEIVNPTTRARAPEVAAAPTTGEKLRAFWASRGEELGARADRMVRLVEGLEGS